MRFHPEISLCRVWNYSLLIQANVSKKKRGRLETTPIEASKKRQSTVIQKIRSYHLLAKILDLHSY